VQDCAGKPALRSELIKTILTKHQFLSQYFHGKKTDDLNHAVHQDDTEKNYAGSEK